MCIFFGVFKPLSLVVVLNSFVHQSRQKRQKRRARGYSRTTIDALGCRDETRLFLLLLVVVLVVVVRDLYRAGMFDVPVDVVVVVVSGASQISSSSGKIVRREEGNPKGGGERRRERRRRRERLDGRGVLDVQPGADRGVSLRRALQQTILERRDTAERRSSGTAEVTPDAARSDRPSETTVQRARGRQVRRLYGVARIDERVPRSLGNGGRIGRRGDASWDDAHE